MTDIKAQLEELQNCDDLDLVTITKNRDLIRATLSAVLKHEDGWNPNMDEAKDGHDVVVKYRYEPDKTKEYTHEFSVINTRWLDEDVDRNEHWEDIDPDDVLYGWKPIDQPSLLERIKEEMG